MKIKFSSGLGYQQDAINAAVAVFEGQPLAQSSLDVSMPHGAGLEFSELGIANHLTLDDAQLLANVHKTQEANDIKKVDALQGQERGHQFSIEMETGTGKTYIYLRTIFELSKRYGFKKFIIVVPSVAIREGVLKSIDMMKEHLSELYDKAPFDHFVYDANKLERVRNFAASNHIQIMVINIQSFQKHVADKDISEMTEEELKKLNVINRESEKMSGRKPIEFIQAAKPILIIDEPQSVDSTDKAKNAIANLHPLATFRYSATHRDSYNLLYQLDPIRAYDLRLVKRIEVASVRADGDFNEAYVKLVNTKNIPSIKAQVQIYKKGKTGAAITDMWVKNGDDLYARSGEWEEYREGFEVLNIACFPGRETLDLSNGKRLYIGDSVGETGDAVMKAQVKETVQQHFNKELYLKGKGIKVLSLFFIDKVENYRVYNDDGTTTLGKIGEWFEAAYHELTQQPAYAKFAMRDLSTIHNGYFSQDSKGHAKNTKGASADDGDTYNLIMRDKERLLDMKEPLRFIFSHSALREGWDNPNVFQICTLNESRSKDKKRQEIGRGLRLAVDQNGERVHDEDVNRLTVIANESYESFARSLQNELAHDYGVKFGCIDKTAFAKLIRKQADGSEAAIGEEESRNIWDELHFHGYIDDEGKVLAAFAAHDPNFQFIISESYQGLSAEIIDIIKRHQPRIKNARERREVTFNTEAYLDPEFKSLWDKISQRTSYRVSFDNCKLVKNAVDNIKKSSIADIEPARITTTIRDVEITSAGVDAGGGNLDTSVHQTPEVRSLPDLLAYLQAETELTRRTLADILVKSELLDKFLINPQQFMKLAAREISKAMRSLIVDGIVYEKVPGDFWEAKRISDEAEQGISRYLDNLHKVTNPKKYLFNYVEYDSDVEKRFAADLDKGRSIRFFIKLPRWFAIDTPLGSYNPDWAFVTERDEKLYFVCETKSTLDAGKRRIEENQKIECGKSHFAILDVDYRVVTKLLDVLPSVEQ